MERNYDYPAKNAVRDAWMRFLPPFFSSKYPVCGLYLPGCSNLELPGYLAKGIAPSHLVGVECLKHLQDRIEMHGSPIHLVRGTIQDAIQMIKERQWYPIAFANFDFDGSYRTSIVDVLSVFTVFASDEPAHFSVSSYCARDDEAMLEGMVNTCKFYSMFESSSRFWTAYGRMKDRYEALRQQLPNSRVEDHAHLSRELGFIWWVALLIGTIENRHGGMWSRNESYLQTFDDILAEITTSIEPRIRRDSELHVYHDPRLSERLKARSCYLWPDRFEHYVWYTAQNQPMRAWMIRLQPLQEDEERPTHFDVIEQLWNMATKTPLIYFNTNGTRISFD